MNILNCRGQNERNYCLFVYALRLILANCFKMHFIFCLRFFSSPQDPGGGMHPSGDSHIWIGGKQPLGSCKLEADSMGPWQDDC